MTTTFVEETEASPSSSSSMNSTSKQRFVLLVFLVVFGFLYAASWESGTYNKSKEIVLEPDSLTEKFLATVDHSRRHQSKFLKHKDTLAFHFDVFSCSNSSSSSSSSSEEEEWWGGTILNAEWAYLYKQKQKSDGKGDTGSDKKVIIPLTDLQQQQQEINWIMVVQDPIDHFLVGYSQVYRQKYGHFPESRITKFDPATYTHKVLQYLKQVKTTLTQMKASESPSTSGSNSDNDTNNNGATAETTTAWDDAYRHSFPQANFILDKNGKVYRNVKLIADLAEVPSILESVMSNDEDKNDEDTTAMSNKSKHRLFLENEAARAANGTVLQPSPTRSYSYFPARRDLLSDYTMREICKFVAIDYYLFDFAWPDACADVMVIDTTMMNSHYWGANIRWSP